MIALINRLLRGPSVVESIARQLHQARLDLLASEASAEHYTAISSMLRDRIARLEAHLITVGTDGLLGEPK